MSTAGELCFGPLALALDPRSLPAPIGAAPGGAERVLVAFCPEGLAPAERRLLSSLPSASFGRFPGGGIDERGEDWLACEPGELEHAARESRAAAVLLAAVRAARRAVATPRLMGVLNVTPDSFSDGGRFLDPARAVERGLQLEAEGADILDVGGESSRPGAAPVPIDEELRRVLPVVAGLARSSRARISIDSAKAAVVRAALDEGASMVNDISAGRGDAAMLPLVAERGAELVLMHMKGTPRDMQRAPTYRDPVAEVAHFLRRRVAACLQAGIALSKMVLDPGIGFGKRLEDNLDLLRRLAELRSLGRPLCLGVSRKSFIAGAADALRPGGARPAAERDAGSAAALAACVAGGAEILRVHDVARGFEAVALATLLFRRSLLPPDPAPSRPVTARPIPSTDV